MCKSYCSLGTGASLHPVWQVEVRLSDSCEAQPGGPGEGHCPYRQPGGATEHEGHLREVAPGKYWGGGQEREEKQTFHDF